MSDNQQLLSEDLYEPSRVYLFGKQFKGLKFIADEVPKSGYDTPSAGAELPMPPPVVEQAFRHGDLHLARIYGYSYEGHYYKLDRPLIFLVRGEGVAPERKEGFLTEFCGLEGKGFSFGNDIRAWRLSRLDVTLCMDIELGTVEELLLTPAVAAQSGTSARSAVASRSAAASRSAMAARSAAAFRSATSCSLPDGPNNTGSSGSW